MKSTLLYALFAFALALPGTADEAFGGKWQIHQSVAGNESEMSCTFTQQTGALAGTCSSPTGEVKIAGKVSDKKIAWTVNTEYNGSPLTLTYTGTLTSAGKIAGTLNVEQYAVEGEFTATLAK